MYKLTLGLLISYEQNVLVTIAKLKIISTIKEKHTLIKGLFWLSFGKKTLQLSILFLGNYNLLISSKKNANN